LGVDKKEVYGWTEGLENAKIALSCGYLQ